MESYCKAEGVTYEKTIPDSPSQNGVAERTNLTIGSMARAMLIDADLKDYFWPFATQAAVHLKNRVPHSSLPPDKTPFELWHRYKPNLSHLRLFGVICTSRILSNNLTKFTPRGETGRFLGYAKDAKGYLVWIPGPNNRGGTVKARRDVTFHDYPVPLSHAPPTDTESSLWDDVTYSDQLVNSCVHIVSSTSFVTDSNQPLSLTVVPPYKVLYPLLKQRQRTFHLYRYPLRTCTC
jgi:hypothetical protein